MLDHFAHPHRVLERFARNSLPFSGLILLVALCAPRAVRAHADSTAAAGSQETAVKGVNPADNLIKFELLPKTETFRSPPDTRDF